MFESFPRCDLLLLLDALLLVASSPLLTSSAQYQASRCLVEGRPCYSRATGEAQVNSSRRARGHRAVPALSFATCMRCGRGGKHNPERKLLLWVRIATEVRSEYTGKYKQIPIHHVFIPKKWIVNPEDLLATLLLL